ncbi:hypothetical protein V1Y59_00340 [Gordonia sp. PKS22-38]|uniref:Mce-associated membrane protein n=1 Tax=Gordonia prachuapensis TaxID=3115651 RepID=A0ABU7MN28_9ACTN|nr:hypothetical protein [Gordonia sp. PKS22-38]
MAREAVLDEERAARAELPRAVDDLREQEVRAGLRRRSRADRWAIGLAVAAVVVAVVVVVGWVRAERSYTDEDFRQAATERVEVLLSPDPRGAGQVRRILDGATGAFRDEFAQSADAYTRFVVSQGTIGRGVVDGAGVSARSGDRASVLVAATVVFTVRRDDAASPEPVQRFRLSVLVEPDDGRLKLAAVQYLP